MESQQGELGLGERDRDQQMQQQRGKLHGFQTCEPTIQTLLLLLAVLSPAHAGVDAAQSLLRAGDVPGALDSAREAIAADPRDVDSHELLIDILLNTGLSTTAGEAYSLLAQQNPDDAIYAYLLGRTATTADGAVTAYSRALDLDPSLGRAWMGLAAVDRALGAHEESLVKYQKALSLDPTLAEAWSALRVLATGDPRAQLAIAQEAMRAVPNDPDAYLAASVLQPQLAATTLRKGVVAVPDDHRLHTALGQALVNAGDFEGARDAMRSSLEIVPASPQVTLSLALVEARLSGALDVDGTELLERSRALVDDGNVTSARTALDDAVKRYPETFLTWYARGNLLAQASDTLGGEEALKLAVSDMKRAYALSPESPDVQAALGLLLLHRGDAADAAPLLANAAVLRPADVQLAIAAARSYAMIPDPRGIPMMEALLERFPADPRPYMAAAELHSVAGARERAYEVLSVGAQRTGNAAVMVALAAAAADLGRTEEAAALLQRLGEAGESQAFLDAAARLRQGQ